jgi:hypothetical protein
MALLQTYFYYYYYYVHNNFCILKAYSKAGEHKFCPLPLTLPTEPKKTQEQKWHPFRFWFGWTSCVVGSFGIQMQ